MLCRKPKKLVDELAILGRCQKWLNSLFYFSNEKCFWISVILHARTSSATVRGLLTGGRGMFMYESFFAGVYRSARPTVFLSVVSTKMFYSLLCL